jgi:guanylate kinase
MIERGEFVQWINPYVEYFGTLHAPIRDAIAAGHDMVFDYVPEGFLNLRRYYPGATVGIFVMAPDMATMRRRLEGRGTEFAAEVEIRYEMARQDFDFIEEHDYLVLNDDFDEALGRLRAIRAAERARVSRLTELPFQDQRRATLVRYYSVPTLPGTAG